MMEIVVGILIGPVVLRLVEIDAPVRILSLFMLAFPTRGGMVRRHVPPKGSSIRWIEQPRPAHNLRPRGERVER